MKNPHKVEYTEKVCRKSVKEGKYINQYLKIKTVGEGPYSKIKLYQDSQKKLYAIKKYNLFILKKKTKMERADDGTTKYSSVADQVKKQIEIMRIPDHPNVVKTHEIIMDKEEEKVYIVMDFCQFGDITHWDSKKERFFLNEQVWKEKSAKQFKDKFLQIAKGIEYLHSQNIIHRDIKPLNILVCENGQVKLIDFGRSVLLKSKEQKLKGSEGTYHFMAPEMLSQKYPGGYDGTKCDIWAFGVSMYGILFGKLPFYTEPMIKLFDQIENASYEFPKQIPEYAKPFLSVIRKTLEADPKDRPSASELISILQEI